MTISEALSIFELNKGRLSNSVRLAIDTIIFHRNRETITIIKEQVESLFEKHQAMMENVGSSLEYDQEYGAIVLLGRTLEFLKDLLKVTEQ